MAASLGCDSATPRVVSAVAGLPEYTPEEASLFGDILTPTVFGLPAEEAPSQDQKLAKRMQRADAVVKVRVATVSETLLAGTRGYTLALAVETPPIRGSAPESPLEIQLGAGSPSLAQVQAEDSKLVGRRFVLFIRHYANHGEPELHWHGEGDTPAFQREFERAKALDELTSKQHTRD
jgi:hypothetical protein